MKNYARTQINIHIIFCLAAIAALLLISSGTAAADDIYVNSTEGFGDYQTIQAAVDYASSYDTIIVAPGTYKENVDIPADKDCLAIRSESGAGLTTVQADNSGEHVFDVKANFTTISGFNVTGATGDYKSGIYLNNVEGCSILNNNASNNYYGIFLDCSSSNTLSNNTANSNNYGIYLHSSSNDNKLYNNNASDNYYGIRLYSSSSNILSNNTANSNTEFGIILKDSNDNTLENNTASNNSKGIYLTSSSNNNLYNNTADSNTNYGIRLYSSNNNNLHNNTADSNTNYGIWLDSSEYDTLESNTASDNGLYGIYLSFSSNDNTLESNTASDNGLYGIYLDSSSGNKFFLNDLLWNSVQVRGDENNVWNSSEPVKYLYNGKRWTSYLGNYYSDYSGSDTEGNGIGDTPYVFDITHPSINDSYPLMDPSKNYVFLVPDSEAPLINSVELSSSSPYAGDSIQVTVNATDNIGVFSVEASGFSLTCTGGDIWQGSLVAEEGTHTVNVSAADAWGNVAWNNSSSYTVIVDTEAPSGVSNLQATAGSTWINWTWNIPSDMDFDHTILYLNVVFLANTSDTYYNVTGLLENTKYELGTLTVDFSGNINETWINDTATTDKTESLEPSSSGGSGTGKARIIPAGTGAPDEPCEDPDGKEDESDGSDMLLTSSGDSGTSKTPTASDVTKASGEEGNDEGNDKEEKSPGFELVFAVSGLLAALHLARKE